jgi:DNA polymerase-3 subunit delta
VGKAIHAFQLLDERGQAALDAVIVVYGAEAFLRRKALESLLERCGTDADAIRSFDGPSTSWQAVHDELVTISLFDAAHQRVAVVRDADKFVTAHRSTLEHWLDHPVEGASLVLEVSTFPATTKLYKGVEAKGRLVQCNLPTLASWGNPVDEKALKKWLLPWAQKSHGLRLDPAQLDTMLDRVGTDLGLLDCELAKLALFADQDGTVDSDRLREIVGGWRTETIWQIADAVADGKIGIAIEQMDRLKTAGQAAIGLFAPLSWSLRRFGLAAQLIEQSERFGRKPDLKQALELAGFRKFDLAKAETQLRRIGRPRARLLLEWLAELELKLKGSHSSEHAAQFALEEFLVRLA